MRLLVDADLLVYRFCAACQESSPFNKDLIIKACPVETWKVIEMRLEQCSDLMLTHFNEDVDITMCFSSSKNFRKTVNPSYKSNRKDIVRPILLSDMRAKAERLLPCVTWDNLEADDVMGLLQDEDSVILSSDKDMMQIPGFHMNIIDPEVDGIYEVKKADGDRMFRIQCLAGDSTDGYYGCPGIGLKKAAGIIDSAGSAWWRAVVEAYRNAKSPKTKTVKTEGGFKRVVKLKVKPLGLTEADALMTARMAYILREDSDYNRETGEVNLWLNPMKYQ